MLLYSLKSEGDIRTKIKILEAIARTVVKYGSETWALRKTEENILDVFQGNSLKLILETCLNCCK